MNTNRTVSTVLRLAALATFVIGLATLLAPGLIVQIFDGYSEGNFHFVRFIGTALIGFSVSNWLYSGLDDLSAVLPGIYGNITSLTIAIVVDLLGLAIGVLSAMAWLIVLLHVAFDVAFIYCVWLVKQCSQQTTVRET